MPTVPSEPPAQDEHATHRHRQIAESFGMDAERYDRARPRYPDELVQRIVAGSPGPDVLDVGCGTGIVARQLQAAGSRVLGVDPDARMADFARGTGVDVEVATFEEWDPAGREFDTVVAGQTWHWVDPIAGADKAARVLRPAGRLAVFGHVFQPPAAVAEAFAAVYRRLVPDSPIDVRPTDDAVERYRVVFDRAADGIRQAGRFGEPEHWRVDWEQSYTRDTYLDQLPTTGVLTRLSPDTLAEVLDEVGDAIDALGGRFTMSFATLVASATRQ